MKISDITTKLHKDGTYVCLTLVNESATRLHSWCEENDIETMPANDYHCTVIFSETSVPQLMSLDLQTVSFVATFKEWRRFGECDVLLLDCEGATLLQDGIMNKTEATSNHDEYLPHITITPVVKTDNPPTALPDFPVYFDTIKVTGLEDGAYDKYK